jgi:hypothetical protein
MARINLDELRADEEMRNKDYVWKKPLKLNINKGRRATDADVMANKDRRLSGERREYLYDEHVPELRSGAGGRRVSKRDRRS